MRDIWGWPRSCSIVLVLKQAGNSEQRGGDGFCPLGEGGVRNSYWGGRRVEKERVRKTYPGLKGSLMRSIEVSPQLNDLSGF